MSDSLVQGDNSVKEQYRTGAGAVYKYIRAIQTEQTFLGVLDGKCILAILEKYNSDDQNMVENIYSIVLADIIGHMAIINPFYDTDFLHEEYFQLSKVFAGKAISDIADIVKEPIKKWWANFMKMIWIYLSICVMKRIIWRYEFIQ